MAAGHEIVLVLTQPRPPGRPRPVLQPAREGVLVSSKRVPASVAQPRSLRLDGLSTPKTPRRVLAGPAKPGLAAMVSWPPTAHPAAWVLRCRQRAVSNIHRLAAATLARRGADPRPRAGDRRETGITIMQMDASLTPARCCSGATPITDDDSGATLHDRLAVLGAQTIGPEYRLAGHPGAAQCPAADQA